MLPVRIPGGSNHMIKSNITIESHPEISGAYRLTTELHLPQTSSEVFEFFGDAFNLEAITPPWLHFAVLTPRPIEMSAGTLIDYRLRLHGIPIRWRTKITCWEPPLRFMDEQLRGPYKMWRHLHTFEDVDAGCLARDQVDYAVPGGRLIHALVVRRDVEKIFDYRRQVLATHFSASNPVLA